MNNYKINSKWCLWYHSINNNKWTKESYKKIININNLLDYHFLQMNFERQHLQNGMFFIMRDGIFPTWEDPDNREGCCISFKISNTVLQDQWNFIINRILTEDILKDRDKYKNINGVSIAPKKEFNILKIWLRNHNENYDEFIKEYSPNFTKEKALIKKHELSN